MAEGRDGYSYYDPTYGSWHYVPIKTYDWKYEKQKAREKRELERTRILFKQGSDYAISQQQAGHTEPPDSKETTASSAFKTLQGYKEQWEHYENDEQWRQNLNLTVQAFQ